MLDKVAITPEVGGNYQFANPFGSFTSIKVMPVDEHLKPSYEYFTVQTTVRAKQKDGETRVQTKPLRTYPISEYEHFMKDLMNRGDIKKYDVGGKVVDKNGELPDAKKGGFAVGKSHAEGGIKGAVDGGGNIEFERNEVIITAPAVKDTTKREFEGEMLTNKEILSRINQSGGGVAIFEDGGDIKAHDCGCTGKMYNYGGKMMSDNDIVSDIANGDYRPEWEKRQDQYKKQERIAYKKGGAIGYYLTDFEKHILKLFKSGGIVKTNINRSAHDKVKRLEDSGYVYTIPDRDGECMTVYVTEHGTNMLEDHEEGHFNTDSDYDCGCDKDKKYEYGGEVAEMKAVKVDYDNGDTIATSVNPNVSDDDIREYFKVGSEINIGDAPNDKMAKITNVEIVDKKAGKGYQYFKGVSASYDNQFQVNKAIEELVDNVSPENMTVEEKAFLLYYSGYGGLEKYGATGKGLLYEYFTPSDIAKTMWGLAYKYGYKGGRVLEPSCGIGEFIRYAPSENLVTGFEINEYSAKICQILYPMAKIIRKEFETNFIKNNSSIRGNVGSLEKYSLVIGNPPYGSMGGIYAGMGEKSYTKSNNYIDYFITRGLDLLEKNGLLIYIIGTEVAAGGVPFLQQKPNPVKTAISQKAILLDAYRLPNGVFERTDVLTDIIVLQKK